MNKDIWAGDKAYEQAKETILLQVQHRPIKKSSYHWDWSVYIDNMVKQGLLWPCGDGTYITPDQHGQELSDYMAEKYPNMF